ncbi:CPBP family intramembrane glutamic endopeptidase [Pontibacter sp. SGAir0037]|uniref:CPBP family intramembrane glutamic endopeptidase n=1 Tax=Pontibacter sp. SGAir0037 TaxID=2571030 RepID=UPI0010CD42B2|nr:CPBP family intramembrane glutamic endopeptidase [Pontibacter sp. SGAir0037]QCR24097.1 CPBP family intramembrane metalloprotease domain-containing protein [Pontibacter sp. SGAir0037]
MKGFISKEVHPFFVLLLLIAFVFGGAFVATFFYSILGDALFGIGIFDLAKALDEPAAYPNTRNALMFYQGIVSFFMFIVAPLLLISSLKYNVDRYLNWKTAPTIGLVLLSGLLIILIMPANSLIIDWNANVNFPESMKGFEEWAREKESFAAELTKLLAKLSSVPELLVGLLVIAVIPAIGEELVFRGVAQRQFHRWTGNGHIAIWIAAFAFSAIHNQFFGFFPRMILGALFGYLYMWSGRISVPIIAHFVNNGFQVLMLYLYQAGQVDMDLESTESMPWYSVLISVVLSAGVIYYLYKQFSAVPPRQEALAPVNAKEPDPEDPDVY